MNKREIKKELKNIADQVEALADEVETTRDDIEPYDGKDDLTEQQEERYEWLDDLSCYLYDLANELRDYDE